MNIERGKFPLSQEEADRLSDERADADIAAGRGVPHALVREWLLTWGTPDEKPMPESWLR